MITVYAVFPSAYAAFFIWSSARRTVCSSVDSNELFFFPFDTILFVRHGCMCTLAGVHAHIIQQYDTHLHLNTRISLFKHLLLRCWFFFLLLLLFFLSLSISHFSPFSRLRCVFVLCLFCAAICMLNAPAHPLSHSACIRLSLLSLARSSCLHRIIYTLCNTILMPTSELLYINLNINHRLIYW